MILSASRRTDVPAFYAEWFMDRIKAGEIMARNPMNRRQVSRVALDPERVDCIVFWTKDAGAMLPYLAELDKFGYNYYFQFTVTGYGKELETSLRPKSEITATFRLLADKIGAERVVWRYDPIIGGERDHAWHVLNFAKLCSELSGSAERVIISFADEYKKLRFRIPEIAREDMLRLAADLKEIAESHGLSIHSCCEELSEIGVKASPCIDAELIRRISGMETANKPDKNQRGLCGCAASVDIGAYNSCGHGCVYCYANHSPASVKKNMAEHRPDSPMLLGGLRDGDRIFDRA